MIPFEFLRLVPRSGSQAPDVVAAFLGRLPYVRRIEGEQRWAVAPNRRDLESRLENPGWNPPILVVGGDDIILEGHWYALDLGRIRQFIEWLTSRDDWRVSKIASLDWPEPERDLGWLRERSLLDDLFGPLLTEDPYPLEWPIETGQLLEWWIRAESRSASITLHDSGLFAYRTGERWLHGRLGDQMVPRWREALRKFDDEVDSPDGWAELRPVAAASVHTPERESYEVQYDPKAPPPDFADLNALALRLDEQCREWRDGDPLPPGVAEMSEYKR